MDRCLVILDDGINECSIKFFADNRLS